MQKQLAEKIVANILKAGNMGLLQIELQLVINIGDKIVKFHQWANNREHVGVFKISLPKKERYYLAFIQWRKDDNYYLVIFDSNKTRPLAELHKIKNKNNSVQLCWKYIPRKRDGKNDLRKKYFKDYCGDMEVSIKVPNEEVMVEEFLQNLVVLAKNRVNSDKLVRTNC